MELRGSLVFLASLLISIEASFLPSTKLVSFLVVLERIQYSVWKTNKLGVKQTRSPLDSFPPTPQSSIFHQGGTINADPIYSYADSKLGPLDD